MQISNGWKPLPALQAAIDAQGAGKPKVYNAADTAGQTLPSGKNSTAAAPAQATPASQFASSALNYLTTLQSGQSGARHHHHLTTDGDTTSAPQAGTSDSSASATADSSASASAAATGA